MSRSEPHSPSPAAVQRLRVRYAKRGRFRFASHRDFQRAFERALRRADVPMAFSQGFSPHPKVSYAGAAPTGSASEAEYLEIAVVQRCDSRRVTEALNGVLPAGLDIVEIVEAGPGSLPDRLTGSHWQIRLPGMPAEAAERAAATFLRATAVEVERLTKSGRRTFDVRSPVVRLELGSEEDPQACAILDLVVRHGTPSVRPDDVLAGLRRVAQLVPPVPPIVTRLAQGPLDEISGTVGDPLAPDREADQRGSAGAAVPGAPTDA